MATLFPNPYEQQYLHPKGPGDTRPTALQIIRDNNLIGQWEGRVCLVTGGTSGIGLETVRALHATRADVYFTARSIEKGESARNDVQNSQEGGGKLEFIVMEGQSLASVKHAAAKFLRKSDRLDILINNAGIMAPPYGLTEDGMEQQFGVNHLSHFLLIYLLLPTLQSSSSTSLSSRIVQVSSSGHRYGAADFSLPRFTPDSSAYSPGIAYGQSKTAMSWTANYIDRVYGPHGVHAHSVHPGGIWSNLQRHLDPKAVEMWKADPAIAEGMFSPEQGAATQVWAAVARDLEGLGGRYLVNCSEAKPTKQSPPYQPKDNGYAPHIYDLEGEERLWKESLNIIELGF